MGVVVCNFVAQVPRVDVVLCHIILVHRGFALLTPLCTQLRFVDTFAI